VATADNRLSVTLDPTVDIAVDIDIGVGDEPTRVHGRFAVPEPEASGLTADIVETVVLGRSAMIDARIVSPDSVETVVAIYPDGLIRQTFMTAVFEVQKLRDLVCRGAADRVADAATMAELERLVAASDPLDGEG
jgi:hypothetical protein